MRQCIHNRQYRDCHRDTLTYLPVMMVVVCLYLLYSPPVNAYQSHGWLWYSPLVKPPKPLKKALPTKSIVLAQTTYPATMQLKHIQAAVKEARARAVLYPTQPNLYQYIVLQHWASSRAAAFARVWPAVLLAHPELDRHLQYPNESRALQLRAGIQAAQRGEHLRRLAKTHVLFLFYRGGNALDTAFAQMLSTFARAQSFKTLAVSMDGKSVHGFRYHALDTGQAKRLHVKALPAVLLVDPKTEQVQPVSYGFLSLTDFESRLAAFGHAKGSKHEGVL